MSGSIATALLPLLVIQLISHADGAITSSYSLARTSYRDCAEIAGSLPGYPFQSGVYSIVVGGSNTPIDVYCNMTFNRGGWLVIQRRVNGNVDFYQNWNTYASGFGDLDANFYLGNEYIHAVTSHKQYTLRIDMTDFQGNSRYAEYSQFAVGSSGCLYPLLSVGNFCGNAGDSLTNHVGYNFSTYDSDNDHLTDNSCAVIYHGAWWYSACYSSNLNGPYVPNGNQTAYADGIVWLTWTGYWQSLAKVSMMIRPVDY